MALLLFLLSGSVPAASGRSDPGTTGIAGTVLGPDGKPAEGALVLLRHGSRLRPGLLLQREAVSDPDGRFRFDLPPDASEPRLDARLPGAALATAPEGVPAAPGTRAAVLPLAPRALLQVTFRVPQGLPPAEGAASPDREERWTPFAGGRLLLIEPGTGTVGVRWHTELYGGGAFFARLAAGAARDTVIDLARPDWLEGRVLDAAGDPAAGVLYRAENAFRGMPSVTGPDGVFRVRRARSGALLVHFRDPRFRDTVAAFGRGSSRAGAGERAEVRLAAGAPPIRGQVLPAAGEPGACLVSASPWEGRKPAGARVRWLGGEIRRAAPGPDGSFALAGLEPETYLLRYECPGLGLREDTASPGAALPPVALGPARSLEVRVASAAGAPLPAFRLRALGVRPESPESALRDAAEIADSLGRAVLAPRLQGASALCADAPGHAAACRLVSGGDTLPVHLRLEAAASLRVRVLAAGTEGAPLPGARVRARRAGSRSAGRLVEADAEGFAAFDGLARGDYALEAREGSRLPFRALVALAGDTALEARLPEGRALTGTLLDAEGRPARGLRVLAKPDWPGAPGCPGGIVESPVAADGAFSLAGLGDCAHTLGVAALRGRATPFLPLYRRDGLAPGSASLELRLPARRAWEITATTGGRPLAAEAEVHVLVLPASDSLPGEALGHSVGKAAFRGTYTVPAFVGQRYVAVVAARGHRERADTVTVGPGAEPLETRIELPAWSALRGRLAGGEAAAAAHHGNWSVTGPGGTSSRVDETGAFGLDGLPAGPAPLELRDGRGDLLWAGLGLTGGPEETLPPPDSAVRMAGLGVDAAGLPVAGAAVILRRREGRGEIARAVTDGQGRFELRIPPGPWLACPEDPALACTRLPAPSAAADSGAASAAAEPRVRLGAPDRRVAVALGPIAPLPLRGAAALLWPGSGPEGLSPLEAREGDALAPMATFRAAPPGRLELVAAAYHPSPATLFWARAPVEGNALRVEAGGTAVTVSAADPAGKPLRGVQVRFLPRGAGSRALPWGEAEGWHPPTAVLAGTDASGTLRCLGVPPGKWWVHAYHPTHAAAPLAWEAGRAGSPSLALALAPGGTLRVKATYGGGAVAGVRVEVLDSLGRRAAPVAAPAREGEIVEVGAFPPGRYRVAVSAPGLGRFVGAASLAEGPGAEANLEAALPAAGWLELVGEDLEGRSFHLKDRTGQVIPLVRQAEVPPLGPDGSSGVSLLFHGITPDTYEVWMEGGSKELGEVEIRPARVSVLDVGRPGKVRVALPVRRG